MICKEQAHMVKIYVHLLHPVCSLSDQLTNKLNIILNLILCIQFQL